MVLEHRAAPNDRTAAYLAVTLRDSVWTLTGLGSLGVDWRLRDDASERDFGPCRCQRSRSSSEEGTRMSRSPQSAFARSASTQSARHVIGAQAPERAAQRHNSGKVVSVLYVVCGSCGGRVVRRSLLSNCPGAPTPGRLLALRDVLLGFLPGSQRTARLDSVPFPREQFNPPTPRDGGPEHHQATYQHDERHSNYQLPNAQQEQPRKLSPLKQKPLQDAAKPSKVKPSSSKMPHLRCPRQ